MKPIKLILLFYFLIQMPNIQAIDFENMRFEHLSTKDGLSQNVILTSLQDKNGYLWFGTQGGLNRYDGRQFKRFNHLKSDKSSISHDNIRNIYQDKKDNIWVATEGGLNRLIDKSLTFKRVEINDQNGKRIDRFNVVYSDREERLWVGTNGGGLFYSVELDIFEPYFDSNDLNDADIREIFEDSKGRLWVGTNGKGVAVISKDRKKLSFLTHEKTNSKSLSHDQIRSITEDYKGQIWIGTRGGGVNRYDEITGSFSRYVHEPKDYNSLSNNRVYDIFEDNEKRLWFATDSGLSIYKPETDEFERLRSQYSTNTTIDKLRVYSITQDRGENLWLGTLSGLFKWNPRLSVFNLYRHIENDLTSLSNDFVYALAEDKSGNIIIGTIGSGFTVFNPKLNKAIFHSQLNQELNAKLGDRVMSLMIDRNGLIWVGTLSRGVYVISQDFKLVKHYEEGENSDSLSENGITSLLQDSNGDIWISTYRGGVNKLKNDSSGFEHYRTKKGASDSLLTDNIYQLMQNEKGYIWIATDGGGLSRLNTSNNEIKNFINTPSNPKSLPANSINYLSFDSKGRVIIGTQSNGLILWEQDDRFNGIENFKNYTIENGLNSNTINGAIEVEDGSLWVSTTRGVSKFDPLKIEFKHYPLAEEIHFNEFNQNALLRASDGRLYFGGINGISAFYPSEIKDNEHIPPVVLTNVLSENKPLQLDIALHGLKEIEFSHTDYLVAFEFAALDFANPKKNQYQYKLEGFDENWIQLGHLNRATFTNLPSGQYTLKVKGSNDDGLWSDDSINLKVIVTPPSWASWWAISLYIITALILMFLFIHFRTQRTIKYSKKLETSVAERTHEVETQRKTIEEMLVRKNELFANVSHEFRTPLTLILGPVAKLIKSSNTQTQVNELNMVERNAKRLLFLVEQLLSLAKVTKNEPLQLYPQLVEQKLQFILESFRSNADEKNIQLVLNCEKHCFVLASDDAIETVFSNLLSNALKYCSNNSVVTVNVVKGLNKKIISVNNTGSLIDVSELENIFEHFNRLTQHQHIQGSGIGLAVVKELITLNLATIVVESSMEKGTTFIIEWPSAAENNQQLCLNENHINVNQDMISGLVESSKIQKGEFELSENNVLSDTDQLTESNSATLLVVEDNADMRQFIVASLNQYYRCITAENGQVGFEVALSETPDLIISDVMMPVMDGFQLTNQLRSDNRTSHIPVILLTAKGDKESRLKGWQENIDEYLTKPFDANELLLRIENILSIRKLLQQRFISDLGIKEKLDLSMFESDEPGEPANEVDEQQEVWGRAEQDFILKYTNLIKNQYSQAELNVIDIAKQLFMSERQFRRKLTALLGVTPADYLRNYRLEKAAENLENGASVSEVAFDVGFTSHSYFSKCFKIKYGKTPSDYS